MSKKFEIKDYTDKKSVARNFHKQRRCDVSGGYVYGSLVIMRQGKGRGSGIAINKGSFLAAIVNSPTHFKQSLANTLLNDEEARALITEALEAPKKEEYEAPEITFHEEDETEVPEASEEPVPFAEPPRPIEDVIKEITDAHKHGEMLKVVEDAEIDYGKKRPTKRGLAQLIISNNLIEKLGE